MIAAFVCFHNLSHLGTDERCVGVRCDVILYLRSKSNYPVFEHSFLFLPAKDMNALQLACLVAVILSLLSAPVSAMAYGVSDGLAIVFLAIVGIVVMCALFGFLARRKGPI